jgi:hypothetical protein
MRHGILENTWTGFQPDGGNGALPNESAEIPVCGRPAAQAAGNRVLKMKTDSPPVENTTHNDGQNTSQI